LKQRPQTVKPYLGAVTTGKRFISTNVSLLRVRELRGQITEYQTSWDQLDTLPGLVSPGTPCASRGDARSPGSACLAPRRRAKTALSRVGALCRGRRNPTSHWMSPQRNKPIHSEHVKDG